MIARRIEGGPRHPQSAAPIYRSLGDGARAPAGQDGCGGRQLAARAAPSLHVRRILPTAPRNPIGTQAIVCQGQIGKSHRCGSGTAKIRELPQRIRHGSAAIGLLDGERSGNSVSEKMQCSGHFWLLSARFRAFFAGAGCAGCRATRHGQWSRLIEAEG